MRLTPDVALVGGGTFTGFGLSADFDAHVYLLDGGGGALALVDCGMGTELGRARVLERIPHGRLRPRGRRAPAADPLPHGSRRGCRGVPRGARAARGDRRRRAGRAGGARPRGHAVRPRPARGHLPRRLRVPRRAPSTTRSRTATSSRSAACRVRYLATPGHCAGHGSYLVTGGERTYLLAGDAVFHSGKLFLQGIPDCDLQASLASVRRLAGLEFEALLPGHGAIALHDGGTHVGAALATIDRLGVPPNIV